MPRLSSARAASCRSPAASATACASRSAATSPSSRLTLALPMLTSACARVRSSPSRVASSSARSPQIERRLGVLREHRELGDDAVGARELDRRAERLEDRDRLERRRARGVAVAGEPVEARQRRGCSGRRPRRRRARGRSRSRARSRRTRRRAGRRRRPRSPAPRAPSPARRAGSRSTKCERAPVVGVRLAVRLERRRPPRGDERVLGDDVLGARGLGVVDDVAGSAFAASSACEDLGVQPPPRRDREARPDRVPRQLVAEADVRGRRPRAAAGAPAPPPPRPSPASPRRAASVPTRFGTTETSSTSRRDGVVEPATRARAPRSRSTAAARRPPGRRAAR